MAAGGSRPRHLRWAWTHNARETRERRTGAAWSCRRRRGRIEKPRRDGIRVKAGWDKKGMLSAILCALTFFGRFWCRSSATGHPACLLTAHWEWDDIGCCAPALRAAETDVNHLAAGSAVPVPQPVAASQGLNSTKGSA